MEYTILKASDDFATLSNSVGRYKEKLCKKLRLVFRSQDFRLVFLDTIQQYLLSLTSYIRAFVGLQQKVSPDEFLKILNIGILTVQEYEESGIIYKFPIESLVTMVHFQIDSFFGEICRQKESPRTGFYNRMKEVLDGTDIGSKEKDDYQNTLQCLAFFRNSFHNRGLHSIQKVKWNDGAEPPAGDVDRVFSKQECKIEFRHNEVITYNWRSTFLLIEESIEVVKSLITAIVG
ncbi:MAG: hypothetical protein JRF50_05350 [Deltaproteobacteria bacterium]|nr:hypothetical protein [Deltaproteobacteria bacterium]